MPLEIRVKGSEVKTGLMTAREILQVVGTDIFRNYFDTGIWVKATMREIEKDPCLVALISDVRFPEEVDIINENNGYIFQLTRDVCKIDAHISEKALNNYDFNRIGNRYFIIDNKDMSIEKQNIAVIPYFNQIFKEMM